MDRLDDGERPRRRADGLTQAARRNPLDPRQHVQIERFIGALEGRHATSQHVHNPRLRLLSQSNQL
jgi:hypothetical protein